MRYLFIINFAMMLLINNVNAQSSQLNLEELERAANEFREIKTNLHACAAKGGFYAPTNPNADAGDCLVPPTCNASSQKIIFDGTKFSCANDRK